MWDSRGGPRGLDPRGTLVPHIAYQQLMHPVTGISIMGNNHATRIPEYTCNINIDLYDKNIETIHACVTEMCK